LPAHGNGPDAIIQSMTDFPSFSADDSNVRSRRRSQNFFERGEAAGALDSGALDPRSPPAREGMFTTDVVDDVDALEQPAAAGRKRRRTEVLENPTGACGLPELLEKARS
jgi:hypothetical protein